MQVKISQVGNSEGIRIPAPVLRDMGIGRGDTVDLELRDNVLRISKVEPVSRLPRITIEQMLAECDPNAPRDAESEAWLNMAPVGKERFWEENQ